MGDISTVCFPSCPSFWVQIKQQPHVCSPKVWKQWSRWVKLPDAENITKERKQGKPWVRKGHERSASLVQLCHPQVGLAQPKDVNGTSAQRGCPDACVKTGNFHRDEEALQTAIWDSHLTSLLPTFSSVTYLFFETICWLWSWNITWSRVGMKHIGNQGQCPVSFPGFICLDLSQWQLRTGPQTKALTGKRTAWEIHQAGGGTIVKNFNISYNLLGNFSKLHIPLYLLSTH